MVKGTQGRLEEDIRGLSCRPGSPGQGDKNHPCGCLVKTKKAFDKEWQLKYDKFNRKAWSPETDRKSLFSEYSVISASNEPGGHACMDIWRMPREPAADCRLTKMASENRINTGFLRGYCRNGISPR